MIKIKLPTKIKEDDYDGSRINELFKVKLNQVNMIKNRGFDVSREEALFTYRISDFVSTYKNIARQSNVSFKESMRNQYIKPDGTTVFVCYPETPKDAKGPKNINRDQIVIIMDFMTKNDITNIIIITETPLTPEAIKAFVDAPLYRMEHFLYEEMTYNPNDHYLVPKHRLMSHEEVSTFLKRNKLNLVDLPGISLEDPIARYFGALPGQVFEIYRENLAVDTLIDSYTAHRRVVHTKLF